MHSGANMMTNQKLFYGDMLSFIQVAKFDYTISSFISFGRLQWSLITVCKINLSIDLIQASGQQIPIVVESCICFINLNGKYSRVKVH